MSSALAAPLYPSSGGRQPDDDAIAVPLAGIGLTAALHKGLSAVYRVLIQRSDARIAQSILETSRALAAHLPDPKALPAQAIQFRVVVIGGKTLGVEAALIANHRIPADADATVPLVLPGFQNSFAALTGS